MEMDHYTESSKTVTYSANMILHFILELLNVYMHLHRTKCRQKICSRFLADVPSAKAERKKGLESPGTQFHLLHSASERKGTLGTMTGRYGCLSNLI